MKFTIRYHELVVRDDIPHLPKTIRERAKRAIEERLMTAPELYGKPLRRSLHGYRKLRVGDYRIIFKINENVLKILMIQHRSVIYRNIWKRIS